MNESTANESAHGAQPQYEPEMPPATQRAEVLVDAAGQRLGHFATLAGQRLQKWVALAREEGEDIWAEAQDIRRHIGQPAPQATAQEDSASGGKERREEARSEAEPS